MLVRFVGGPLNGQTRMFHHGRMVTCPVPGGPDIVYHVHLIMGVGEERFWLAAPSSMDINKAMFELFYGPDNVNNQHKEIG